MTSQYNSGTARKRAPEKLLEDEPMKELVPPDLISNWIPGEKTLDSAHLQWNGISVTGYRYNRQEVHIPPMRDYMIVVYQNSQSVMRRRDGGPWKSATVEPGVISLLTRGEASVWQWDSPIDVRHIYLSQEAIERTLVQVFGRGAKTVEIDDHVRCVDETMPHYLTLLERELKNDALGGNLYIDALKTQIAIHILRQYARLEITDAPKGVLGPSLRKTVIDYIDETLADDVHLDDLASCVKLSPFHFSRKFKSEFGVSPHIFVTQRRIERAKNLLREKRLPIKFIAFECGFADQSHFNKVFKKFIGVTPDGYRKES
jgi:AraC family transcriptional regulator